MCDKGKDKTSNVFKVENILNHKMDNQKIIYKVKWLGYSKKECTYEPSCNFDDFELIEKYYIELLEKKHIDVSSYTESDNTDDDEIGVNDDSVKKKVFKVEMVLHHKMDGKNVVYKVKWLGYSKRGCTYEPSSNFEDFSPIEMYYIDLLKKN